MDETFQFLIRHGYSVLFLWVLAEQLGLPLPATPLLLAAGALAGAGQMNLWVAITLAVLASLLGDLSWYEFGRLHGGKVLNLLCRISLEPDSCVRKTENAFVRHSSRSLLIAKFVPGLNTMAPPLAGIIGMRRWRFLTFDALGALLYIGSFIALGFMFSNQLEQVAARIARLGFSLLVVLAGGLAAYITWKYIQRHRFIRSLRIARITPEELKRKIEAGEEVVIVDLRGSLDFEAVVIRLSCLLFLVSLMAFPISSSAQEPSIDLALAEQYFQEAHTVCLEDNSKLWGVSLCGPLMFVEPGTRMIVANQSDSESILVNKGNVFVGRLPEKETIANTATRWAGIKWTMVIWPLPSNKQARARLLMHELYHRIQDDLSLPASNPPNNHLDTRDGRMWLQLEWRALRRALEASSAESRNAIEDALVFRLYRRSLFPDSDSTERGLEMNEGLAEYTGIKLRGSPDQESATYLAKQLETAEGKQTFVRSFAYASGPAYGFLLDRSKSAWRRGLKPTDDLGVLAQLHYSIKLPANLKVAADKRSIHYGGDTLSASETERNIKRQKRAAEHRARLIDGPVLALELTDKVSYGFNPNNVESLDGLGTVYPTLRVSDAWGILEVTGGALMMLEGARVSRVQVPAPADPTKRKVEGDGWTLELSEGWKLVFGARKGDYTTKKIE